jgi:dihydropteroate synthase
MVPRKSYRVPLPAGRALQLGERTLVMGVLNLAPDSFTGGASRDPARAIEEAKRLADEGADILDIGGESTRPGAGPVPEAEELARVLPVLEQIAGRVAVPISIDTYKAAVADAALACGAAIVNDISGLQYDPALAGVVARRGAAVVLMHTRGRPVRMYDEARYDDVVGEVAAELAARVEVAVAAGISRDRLILDPGLGFAKRAEHSYAALAGLARLAALDRPLLVGPSRKSFLSAALGERPPAERDWGTAAAVAAAVLLGTHIVRVHAVREMVDVVRVADRVREYLNPAPGS